MWPASEQLMYFWDMYQPHSGRATYSYYWPGSTHSYIILMEFVSMAVDDGDMSPLFSVGALGTAPEMSPRIFQFRK